MAGGQSTPQGTVTPSRATRSTSTVRRRHSCRCADRATLARRDTEVSARFLVLTPCRSCTVVKEDGWKFVRLAVPAALSPRIDLFSDRFSHDADRRSRTSTSTRCTTTAATRRRSTSRRSSRHRRLRRLHEPERAVEAVLRAAFCVDRVQRSMYSFPPRARSADGASWPVVPVPRCFLEGLPSAPHTFLSPPPEPRPHLLLFLLLLLLDKTL